MNNDSIMDASYGMVTATPQSMEIFAAKHPSVIAQFAPVPPQVKIRSDVNDICVKRESPAVFVQSKVALDAADKARKDREEREKIERMKSNIRKGFGSVSQSQHKTKEESISSKEDEEEEAKEKLIAPKQVKLRIALSPLSTP